MANNPSDLPTSIRSDCDHSMELEASAAPMHSVPGSSSRISAVLAQHLFETVPRVPNAPNPTVMTMTQQTQPAPPPFSHLLNSNITPATDEIPEHGCPEPPEATQVLMVSIEFERGSNLANQPTVVDTMKLPSNMSATEFRHAIVDAMGLDIEVARLAYTITGKIGRPVSRAFNTDEQVNYAKHDVLGAMSRARSKQKGLSIKNLDPVPKANPLSVTPAPAQPPSSSEAAPSKSNKTSKTNKEKEAGFKGATAQTAAIEELRSLYRCHICDSFCFVCPRTSRHIRLTHEMLSLWAKQHTQNPRIVTLSRPPNHRLFDRSRGVKPISGNKAARGSSPCEPIDVDDPLSGPFASPKLESKPSRSPSIIYISSDDNDDSDSGDIDSDLPDPFKLVQCQTPPPDRGRALMLLLSELDEAFPGKHDFLLYVDVFLHADVTHVGDVDEHDVHWLTQAFDMPEASAMILMGSAMAERPNGMMVGRAKYKGKGKSKW